MTDQNNAAQPVLTDDEIRDIADGFDIYGAKPEFARAIESALLSKLRAPVADEPCKRCGGPGWYTSHTTGYPESIPCSACNPQGISVGRLEKDPFLAAQLWRKPAVVDGSLLERILEHVGEYGESMASSALLSIRSIARRNVETRIAAELATLASAPVAGEAQGSLAPSKCPITGRPFFMALEHPELGKVPTYGGPYDSYTIPHLGGKPDQPWHERELRVYRYDHDLGGWLTDEVEVIPLRIVHEDVLHELQDAAPQASEAECSCPSGDGSLRHPCAVHPASEAVRDAALEEAAQTAYKALFPTNDRSDWTEFAESASFNAKYAAQCIRALKSQSAALSAQPGAQKEQNDA